MKKIKETNGIKQGILYGLIPHAGCIAFLIFSILGVTMATSFFRPLLANKNFFYWLIGLSFIFATMSAMIYLKRNAKLNLAGAKGKWRYLSILYSTTIFVNLFLFLLVFPLTANISAQAIANLNQDNKNLTLQIEIPCSGHAPLITDELKKAGVDKVIFRLPNYFDISYNPSKITKEQILGLKIFQEFSIKAI